MTKDDLLGYFAKQIASASPCDGDFFQGATRDEWVATQLNVKFCTELMSADEAKEQRRRRAQRINETADRRQAEYAAHVGDVKLFYIIRNLLGSITVTSAWMSELSVEEFANLAYADTADNGIPAFVPFSTTSADAVKED